MPSKEEEAEKLMKSAKKHHTKTFTKWSADWDDAAADYEKAAKIYAHLDSVKQTRDAYNLASMAHEKANNMYFSGKMLEALADFLKDQGSYVKTPEGASECTELYCKASKVYALDRKPDRQADALMRASRVAPNCGGGEGAASAYKYIIEGIDALEDHEKFHLTLDLYRACILMQIRAEKYVEAISILKREIKSFEKLQQDSSAAKAGLEIVVICLYIGDWVLADREFKEAQNGFGFMHSKEQGTACELLAAVEERDEERLEEAQADQTLSFLIADIARMAKKIKMVGTNAPHKQPKQQVVAALVGEDGEEEAGAPAPAAEAEAPVEEDDDEDLK